MSAAVLNIKIERGATFRLRFLVKNGADDSAFDLTGYTVESQVRESPESTTLLATITGTVASPATGEIIATISNDDTAEMPLGIMHWDLFIVQASPETKTRLVAGRAEVVATVSRS